MKSIFRIKWKICLTDWMLVKFTFNQSNVTAAYFDLVVLYIFKQYSCRYTTLLSTIIFEKYVKNSARGSAFGLQANLLSSSSITAEDRDPVQVHLLQFLSTFLCLRLGEVRHSPVLPDFQLPGHTTGLLAFLCCQRFYVGCGQAL